MKNIFQSAILIFTVSANVSAHYTCDNVITSSADQPETIYQAMAEESETSVLYEAQVLSSVGGGSDFVEFGDGVALDGNTLAIGKRAPWQEGYDSIEIYELQDGAWVFVKLLRPPNQQLSDLFTRPSLDGETLLVGAAFYCANGGECQSGTAYVFEKDRGGENNWGLVAQLDGGHQTEAKFGSIVALSRDTAVVAAPNEDIEPTADAGAVYIFQRNHGGADRWGLVKRLESDKQQKVEGDFFGYPSAIKDDTVIVIGDDVSVIYEYGRHEGGSNNWGLVQKFEIPNGQSDSLAFDGNILVLLARDPCIPSEERTSHLLFYVRTQAGIWTIQQEINTSLVIKHLALDGNQLVVKAREDTVAYLYQRGSSPDSWELKSSLQTKETYSPLQISGGIAMDGGKAIVGSPYVNDGQGAAFYYNTAESINAGHSGAWFNSATSGQGQFIDVQPEKQFMFISWFTYTDNASENPNEQRWLTAQGNYTGNKAELILYESLGGRFDDPQEVTTLPVGEVTLSFTDCGLGQMTYRIVEEELQGAFPMVRVIPGSGNICNERIGNSPQAVGINAGMDGSWFDSNASGQGFFVDAHPDPNGGNFIFVSWFTYGEDTASGQRWLTAQGGFQGSTAEIDVFETTGGSFDDPLRPDTVPAGTMSLDFSDCTNALLTYSLTKGDAEGSMAITRVIPGGQALCEELLEAN